jgi:AraC family L-rhamnose operon regulatory protein RhaS
MRQRTTFRTARELFHADTCQPLKAAAKTGAVRLAALGRGSYPGERLPKNDLQELCMAGYWDASFDQDWGLDWHCNEGIEIGYVAAGRLPFSMGDKDYQVEPGHLTITRPWQRHRVGQPHVPASHYSWLILDVGMRRPNQTWQWPPWLLYSKTALKWLTDRLRQNEQPIWRANRQIGHCFEQLDSAVEHGGSAANHARLKIHINELIILLAEMFESRQPALDQSLPSSERTVRLFLESLGHRLDEPWTLDSMAAACGLGRTHFSCYCKKLCNVSPVEHLTRLRLQAATLLLTRHAAMSITEIAFRCGFQSSQYFAKVFRGRSGHSPSDHRKNGRSKK